MPRLDSFKLEIKTGERGGPDRPRYSINRFPLDFDETEGSTKPGETLTVTGHPQSFPHTLLLIGPEDGAWDISGVTATYYCSGQDPYTVRMGSVTLEDDADLNIWHEKPLPTFDV